jgi:hypothetical protein
MRRIPAAARHTSGCNCRAPLPAATNLTPHSAARQSSPAEENQMPELVTSLQGGDLASTLLPACCAAASRVECATYRAALTADQQAQRHSRTCSSTQPPALRAPAISFAALGPWPIETFDRFCALPRSSAKLSSAQVHNERIGKFSVKGCAPAAAPSRRPCAPQRSASRPLAPGPGPSR